jgi:AraC family carnitine catabolism transcriptional activator
MVGGVDTGAFALALAGVIGTGESPVVLHWEAVPAFQERFTSVPVLNQIYLVDDKRVHCAGGVATLDLILDLIASFRGEALANEVANALVHTRRPSVTQQRSDGLLESDQSPLVGRLISLMEKNLDFPISLDDLADALGVSSRTLTRTCRRVLGESPMRLYLHIRLQAARSFLFYEESSIKDVANACGFSYPAVFSRAFKDKFGQTPREFRERIRQRQSAAVRPEIRRMMLRLPERQNAAPCDSVELPLSTKQSRP